MRPAGWWGWQKIKLDPAKRTVELTTPGMKLDLGGIAKGYAGDCAIATLKQRGITSVMIEAGGDIVMSDAPPGKAGWVVEIPGPDPAKDGPTLTLANCAIGTSGDTVQFVVIGGVHYSHVIDPRTGMALTSRTMATITAPQGLLSDPLSTAVTLLSREEAEAMVKKFPGAKLVTWEKVLGGK